MPTIELTDDEFETLREVFDGFGDDCAYIDWAKFKALEIKLGFREAEKPLTEEELKKREEFENSPACKMMANLIKMTNESLMLEYAEKIGSELRIKLPNDYSVKK